MYTDKGDNYMAIDGLSSYLANRLVALYYVNVAFDESSDRMWNGGLCFWALGHRGSW